MKKLLLALMFTSSLSYGASSQDLMQIAHNPGFLDRIKYYMQTSAIAVMAEDGATIAHVQRVAYANTILRGTASVDQYATGVLSNTTIAAEANLQSPPGFGIPDTDLPFTVNSLFNAFAGVSN